MLHDLKQTIKDLQCYHWREISYVRSICKFISKYTCQSSSSLSLSVYACHLCLCNMQINIFFDLNTRECSTDAPVFGPSYNLLNNNIEWLWNTDHFIIRLIQLKLCDHRVVLFFSLSFRLSRPFLCESLSFSSVILSFGAPLYISLFSLFLSFFLSYLPNSF